MRAERLYAFFYLTLRPNSGKEQKSLQKESQNRLNTGEKKIRVTLLSPLCVSRNCSLRPFSAHKEFCKGENKKKGKKKSSLRERRENNRRRDIAPLPTSKFLKRGARARILSLLLLLLLTREEKVFSLASSSRIKEEEGLEGAFAARVLEKERERRAGESGTQGEKRRSDKKIYPRRVITNGTGNV